MIPRKLLELDQAISNQKITQLNEEIELLKDKMLSEKNNFDIIRKAL